MTDKQRHIKVILMAKSLRVQIGARAAELGWGDVNSEALMKPVPTLVPKKTYLPTPTVAPTSALPGVCWKLPPSFTCAMLTPERIRYVLGHRAGPFAVASCGKSWHGRPHSCTAGGQQ